MNFYDDVLAIMVLTTVFALAGGINTTLGISFALGGLFAALILREYYSDLMLKLTDRENELVLLTGIFTLIGSVWLTESFGLTALTGTYIAGLLLVETELGFRVRERFDAVKDFFTALSFIAIGYLLTVPSPKYILASVGILAFALLVRPLLAVQLLKLEGYDLRTAFMASLSYSQISEIIVFAALLKIPLTGVEPFDTLAIVFAAGTIFTHAIEEKEEEIFNRLFSDYELESEKSSLPEVLEDHVIIAGYDHQTQGLEELVDGTVVVADYDFEKIEEAEEAGVPHLLADLDSGAAWEKLNVGKASVIVSAIDDQELLDEIGSLETDAEKVLVSKDSGDVKDELRELLRKALE
jgi:Kef-type K+ transport system membrane component KefB